MRRNSVVALAGLVPLGVVGAAATTAASAAHADRADHADESTRALPDATAGASPVAFDLTALGAAASIDVSPAVLTEQAPPPPPEPAPVQQTPPIATDVSAGGIPPILLDAYQNAERILAETQPGCNMYWTLIAGIGRVESTHANHGKVDEHGTMIEPVIGLRLDGSLPGSAVIHDTDGGALDGDPLYDRAVGPTQFLPQTWQAYAMDGNGDGDADPQNVYDSAVTTGNYLCDGGLDMRDPIQAAKAVHRYNNSAAYVANVMAWSTGYATGIVPTESSLPRIH
ncbi:hypothetical protein Rrhod_2466 [Rhodococcus rhodnii LMG 5362]|uniref:Transglycosylase SLT domain-containing protein n=1 Tax=Rhodococcus rhodnii LMG 5362 TaxID=1273125 RepID=R7WLD2_9NOCA|nr:hypothetical protein Rrhod_2466 [Rhodococcus rhodnii LMG 5362]